MKKVKYIRIGTTLISLIGVFLLIRVIYHTVTGEIFQKLPLYIENQNYNMLFALGITLPIPFHVISIGMILQKKWLSQIWKKIAWVLIVTSGVWLGIAFVVKMIIK